MKLFLVVAAAVLAAEARTRRQTSIVEGIAVGATDNTKGDNNQDNDDQEGQAQTRQQSEQPVLLQPVPYPYVLYRSADTPQQVVPLPQAPLQVQLVPVHPQQQRILSGGVSGDINLLGLGVGGGLGLNQNGNLIQGGFGAGFGSGYSHK